MEGAQTDPLTPMTHFLRNSPIQPTSGSPSNQGNECPYLKSQATPVLTRMCTTLASHDIRVAALPNTQYYSHRSSAVPYTPAATGERVPKCFYIICLRFLIKMSRSGGFFWIMSPLGEPGSLPIFVNQKHPSLSS